MTFDKRCAGCVSYETFSNDEFTTCMVPYEFNGKICPCGECLVKMVCEAPCAEFKTFDSYVQDNGGGKTRL
jgi:hypothetical protein